MEFVAGGCLVVSSMQGYCSVKTILRVLPLYSVHKPACLHKPQLL